MSAETASRLGNFLWIFETNCKDNGKQIARICIESELDT